jgi:mono/diheme cytochrome c family protein
VNDAGRRRRWSLSVRDTPRFALVLAAITVTLAGIILGVSILVFLEARDSTGAGLADAPNGNGFRGARIFVNAGCADCHTLASAGASGTRGPNLDKHFASHPHSFGYVVAKISNGGNGMPAFRNRLNQQQIRDVATFVVNVAGGPGQGG